MDLRVQSGTSESFVSRDSEPEGLPGGGSVTGSCLGGVGGLSPVRIRVEASVRAQGTAGQGGSGRITPPLPPSSSHTLSLTPTLVFCVHLCRFMSAKCSKVQKTKFVSFVSPRALQDSTCSLIFSFLFLLVREVSQTWALKLNNKKVANK